MKGEENVTRKSEKQASCCEEFVHIILIKEITKYSS